MKPLGAESADAAGLSGLWSRRLSAFLLAASFLLFALHYLHIEADFPHFSPWLDPARVTDEGWYAGAALRHFLSGDWRLPGDFNPAVALPVFPLLVAALFHFTGVSVAALRALNVTFFGASLLVVWLLVKRYSHPLTAAGAVFLFACSPFHYVYSRLGTLEPLLTLESLLTLWAASSINRRNDQQSYLFPSLATGFLLAAIVFTKTTGLCLYPAVFYLMASRYNFKFREYIRPIALACVVASGLAIAYFEIIARAGLQQDFYNLFAINKDRIHGRIILSTLGAVAKEGTTMGSTLYLAAAVAVLLALAVGGRRRSPLLVASILGIAGYGAFITYHGWLMPRYYLVAMPLTAIALVLALAELAQSPARPLRFAAVALTAILSLSCAGQIRTLLLWTRTPSYSYAQAAQAIYKVIDRDPAGNRVVLSSASEQLSLLTGEPGVFINPVYGTTPLRPRVLHYKPGWLVTFDPVEADKESYSQELVDTEPIFGDDPFHSRLLLYKLTLIHP